MIKNLSVQEGAEVLGICERKLRELIATRQIASIRVGRRRLISEKELENYIHRNTVPVIDLEKAVKALAATKERQSTTLHKK